MYIAQEGDGRPVGTPIGLRSFGANPGDPRNLIRGFGAPDQDGWTWEIQRADYLPEPVQPWREYPSISTTRGFIDPFVQVGDLLGIRDNARQPRAIKQPVWAKPFKPERGLMDTQTTLRLVGARPTGFGDNPGDPRNLLQGFGAAPTPQFDSGDPGYVGRATPQLDPGDLGYVGPSTFQISGASPGSPWTAVGGLAFLAVAWFLLSKKRR